MNSITALDSIDRGVGVKIIDALKECFPVVSDGIVSRVGQHTAGWIKRVSDKEDLLSTVKALTASSGSSDVLPAIVYSRGRGLNSAPTDAYGGVVSELIFDEATAKDYGIRVGWMELNYSLTAIGSSQAAVEEMILMWYFHIAGKSKSFPIRFNFEGEDIDFARGSIQSPQELLTGDISLPAQKVFGLRHDFIVHAPVIYGKSLALPKEFNVTFDFELKV